MEEKFMMLLHKPFPLAQGNACYSPDTDKTGAHKFFNVYCDFFLNVGTYFQIWPPQLKEIRRCLRHWLPAKAYRQV